MNIEPVAQENEAADRKRQNPPRPMRAPRWPATARTDEAGLWYADGDMVRKACTLRAEDDDFGQAGTMAANASRQPV
jgi:catalase